MGTIRTVRDPHNLSHHRMTGFLACAARTGYEGLYDGFKRTAAPYWLAGGGAVHHVIEQILEKTLVQGQVLPKDKVDQEIESARKHVWMVLKGLIPPRGHKDNPSRLQSVFWMSEEEKNQRDPKEVAKIIRERMNRYVNQVTSGIRAVALRCTVPSPFKRTAAGVRFDRKLVLTSPRDPQIRIPVWGEIDVLEQHASGGLIITDWKTGNFGSYIQRNLEGNEQMLIYWLAVRELYGADPMIAYFVSLNIPKWDVERRGESVLEGDRYRAQARIRFKEHFPELLDEMDDVWAVLNFLAHPPFTAEDRMLRDSWEPRSSAGMRAGLKRHVEQGRLIPNIGGHCGMCPARTQCRADNPEDWEEYEARHKLGNVVNPIPHIPEEWLSPFHEPNEQFPPDREEDEIPEDVQLQLFGRRPIRGKNPLHQHALRAKDWKELGFFTPRELVALARRMHQIIPVENGVVCPCRKTERIPPFLLEAAGRFYAEREEHKRAQEAEGKTRGGAGDKRIKDLFDSQVVRQILNHCPVDGCPFAKKANQAPQAA